MEFLEFRTSAQRYTCSPGVAHWEISASEQHLIPRKDVDLYDTVALNIMRSIDSLPPDNSHEKGR